MERSEKIEVSRKLLQETLAVMRACGWQFAVTCEPQTDGVLEAACTEIHDKLEQLLND